MSGTFSDSTMELSYDQRAFLEPFLPETCISPELETRTPVSIDASMNSPPPANENAAGPSDLPFVTLTYAASLDSMISLGPGLRTTLSGPESKAMTHYLRSRHDAILVGVNTAIVDNPSLNCRYPGATFDNQPRPVIIDTHSRYFERPSTPQPEKKAWALAQQKKGKWPWTVCATNSLSGARMSQLRGDHLLVYQDDSRFLPYNSSAQRPLLPWVDIFKGLKQKGIDSVMVEGGATVINSLLAEPSLVNSVIITIAPTFLGAGGVAVAPPPKFDQGGQRENAAWLPQPEWHQFGKDMVLCGKL